MNKETRHLAMAGVVLGLFIAGIVVARQVLTPDSFGQFGYYRGDNVAEWAGLPTTFAETAQCSGCHSSNYTKWSGSAHAGVSCENCHGPGVAHIEKQEPLTVNRTSSLCLTCHERLLARPISHPQVISTEHNPGVSCATCHNPHNPLIGQPPAIPHSLEGRADCLLCHGSQGFKPVPLNHAGRTIEICQLCHKPGSATPSGASPISSPTAAPAAPAVTPTSTAAAAGPPLIPHSLAGRDDCLLCHGSGIAGAPVIPASHAGRTSNVCQLCHKPASATSTDAPSVSSPTAAPSAPTATPTAIAAAAGPPTIPHSLAGRDDCLLCHGSGIAGAPVIPASHAGRTSNVCQLCHKGATQ